MLDGRLARFSRATTEDETFRKFPQASDAQKARQGLVARFSSNGAGHFEGTSLER